MCFHHNKYAHPFSNRSYMTSLFHLFHTGLHHLCPLQFPILLLTIQYSTNFTLCIIMLLNVNNIQGSILRVRTICISSIAYNCIPYSLLVFVSVHVLWNDTRVYRKMIEFLYLCDYGIHCLYHLEKQTQFV